VEEKLSEAEMYIMKCFWTEGEMRSDDVAELVSKRNWKKTTLLTFLSRLIAKNMLSVTKKGNTNIYTPICTESDYLTNRSKTFLNEMFGGSAKSFFVTMINNNNLTQDDIAELKKWLDEKENDENV